MLAISMVSHCLAVLATIPEAPRWWPVLALLIGSTWAWAFGNQDSTENLFMGVIDAFVLRVSMVFAIFVHEWAHIATAIWFGNWTALQSANVWCNISLNAWISTINPLVPWHKQAIAPHIKVEHPNVSEETIIRLSGAAVSVLLAASMQAIIIAVDLNSTGSLNVAVGFWTVAFGAVLSDVLQAEHSKGIFRCGNFGMLIVNSSKKSCVDFIRTLQRMVAITSARGAQSGGLVTLCEDGTAYRCRFVPTKRQDLSVNLMFWFNIGLRVHSFFCWVWRLLACCFTFKKSEPAAAANQDRLRQECRFFAGHTRFATSSAPTIMESHPHRFADPRKERMWRCDAQGQWRVTWEKLQLFVTHNGDFEMLTLFGRLWTHADIGVWLKAVMQVSNQTASGDSAKISGMMQFLRTQGMWLPSLRLAYINVVQPSFEAYCSGAEQLPLRELQRMAAVAEGLFVEFVDTQTQPLQSPESVTRFCTLLANKIVGMGGGVAARAGDCMGLATEATKSFLGNDLFTSLKFFLENAHGSFGLAVCSTLDPNAVVLASRGQPMSLAVDEEQGVVLWGSEASALQVFLGPDERAAEHTPPAPHPWAGSPEGGPSQTSRQNRCYYRHDLEESAGEVVELVVVSNEVERRRALEAGRGGAVFEGARFVPFEEQPSLLMRVFHGREDAFASQQSFRFDPSLVALVDNPHVEPLPRHLPGPQRVGADIESIPQVLARIRMEWEDADSRVCRSASALFEALQRKASSVSANQSGLLEIDVLVMAVEASLWIGEQFASDLQGMFPRLRVVPLSSNKICGVFSNHQGADAMTGFAFSSQTMGLKDAIVIAISHSGQTFPTMHATHTLRKICGDKVFVVAGAIDSKMSAAVGQMAHEAAPWANRVIPTYCGWRPAEALTVTTVACHHTLTELLVFLGTKANQSEPFKRMAGVLLSAKDLEDIQRLHHSFVVHIVPETVGAAIDGRAAPTVVSASLRKQGRLWALHVLEGPYAWCLTAAYVLGTVISSHPPFLSLKNAIWGEGSNEEGASEHDEVAHRLAYVALLLDSLVYIFCPLIATLLLRIVQGRQLFARLGKRTLVIGDVPYVHQLLESYVSKLFSLSYSIASIDVHGANPIDHMVHRFTHRVARGVLLAIGRPDGRLFSQTKAESWILLALQQCKAIVHLGASPEIVTVGHNPYHKPSVIKNSLVLSQHRPAFICEAIPELSSQDTEPTKRMANFKHSFQHGSLAIDSTEPSELQPVGAYLLEHCDLQTRLKYSLLQQMSAAAVDQSNHGLRNLDASAHSLRNRNLASAAVALPLPAGATLPASLDVSNTGSRRAFPPGDHSWHRASPWQPREAPDSGPGRTPKSVEGSGHGAGASLFFRSPDLTTHSGRGGSALRPGGVNPLEVEMALAAALKRPPGGGLDHSSRSAGRDGVKARDSGRGQAGGESPSARLLDSVVSGALEQTVARHANGRTSHSLEDLLNHCTALETWYENRYASLERYLSMLVTFHAMADRVAAFPLLRFDTSRSQSQLRVATTAAPIGASDIQHEWAEGPHRALQYLLDHTLLEQPPLATQASASLEVEIAGRGAQTEEDPTSPAASHPTPAAPVWHTSG